MKAVILAGGRGTRLHPVTIETPKPLLTVKKKPIINYLIEMFRQHNIRSIKIIIRDTDREDFAWWMERYKGALLGMEISFGVEQESMGTMGYLYHELSEWIGTEDICVTNGDELKQIDLRAMEALHKKIKSSATIALVKVNNPKDYGVAICKGNSIVNFLEKPDHPPSNYISSGLYMMSPIKAFAHIEKKDRFLMLEKDLFPLLAKHKSLAGYKSNSPWYDCGTLERWEQAIKQWA
ncbi:MAG: hypothetical protein RIQ54_70 [Candidatus Parcubacteria bacterium]|jgi:NDP-sugar pyrophosphorylase family protein